MPGPGWLNVLFYVGTLPLLLVLLVIIHSAHLSFGFDILAFLLAPLGGFTVTRLFLKWKPNARFWTEAKEEGFGFVGNPMDALAPYLICGFIFFGLIFLARHH